ncbi:lytic transglycosylase domain-containing protein (plasmid) [Phyllobacterium sp. 628]|nr:lytic transglycosylase domain-containing protein [Phyllobacterium sp. 628]
MGPVKVTKIENPSAPVQSPVIAPDSVSCHFDQQPNARDGEETVRRIAKDEHFNIDFAVAVARHESGFRMDSVSPAGAVGLMQLMPATARRFDVDICNSEDNVRGGIRFLKLLEKKYANPLYVLAAYNAGEGAVEQNRGIPLYPETVRYVSAILTDLYGWQPFNDTPVAVATVNRQRKTASEKPDPDSPGTWSQGFVLHVE